MGKTNPEKQIIYRKKHYLANREAIILKAKISNEEKIKRNKEYILNYLLEHPCVDCGQSNTIVLEFDHVRGVKKKEVSVMRCMAHSIKAIQEEIDKCEVRCANCHRIKTSERRNAFMA